MQNITFLCRIAARLAFLAVLLSCAAAAGAATLTVNVTTDDGPGTCTPSYCTLRDAITTASSGDAIAFVYNPNSRYVTISLTKGELLIEKNLTINPGPGLVSIQRKEGNPKFRIFHIIGANTNVSMSRVEIVSGVEPFFGDAAGILNYGTLTLVESAIRFNDGGGLKNRGTAYLVNCEISLNAGDRYGGIHNDVAFMYLTNCTVAFNSSHSAAPAAGGILNDGVLSLTNCTIADNRATGGTGGVHNSQNRFAYVANTIIALNRSSSGGAPDFSGTLDSKGFNLIGNDSGTTFVGDTFGNKTNVDPKLGLLEPNGSQFVETMELLQGSPAIDAGNSPLSGTDQRGFARPVDNPATPNPGDGSDIGAFEVQADKFPACGAINSIVKNNNDSGPDSLRDVMAKVCAGSTITFAPNVRGTIALTTGELLIKKFLTIAGPGANLLRIARDPSLSNSRIFNIPSSEVKASITGLTIANGSVPENEFGPGYGGAILNSGTLDLSAVTVTGNVAGFGGGIHNAKILTLTDSTVSGNSAIADGGGVSNFGTVTITSSTLSGNSAQRHGGATSGNTLLLRNSTVTANSAADSGGGLYIDPSVGSVKSTSSIIALNTAATIGPDVSGTLASEGFNLIGSGNGATISNLRPDDKIGVSAPQLNLGPLQDNGGPTPTHALLAGSVAIDQGYSQELLDQRKSNRRVDLSTIANQAGGDGSDIGAFEYVGAAPVVVTAPATNVGMTTATLNAFVNPNGLSTTYQFTSNFGTFTVQDAGNGGGDVPVSINVSGLSADTTYRFNVTATNAAGTTVGAEQAFTTTPGPGQLLNLSTRKQVETGDNVLIGGFIIVGSQDKRLIVRGLGPSTLVEGALANPTLELRDSAENLLAANDNWRDSQAEELIGTGIPPSDDVESAVVTTLAAKPASSGGLGYTAVLAGHGGGTGIGVLEIYDLATAADSKLVNISTRGFVGKGNDVLIGGFIPGPADRAPMKVLVRALGPSLAAAGVAGPLQDPLLELVDGNGTVLQANDDWQDGQQAEIAATGIPPTNDRESAIIATVPASNSGYTAVVRGINGTTGVGLVEVYALD